VGSASAWKSSERSGSCLAISLTIAQFAARASKNFANWLSFWPDAPSSWCRRLVPVGPRGDLWYDSPAVSLCLQRAFLRSAAIETALGRFHRHRPLPVIVVPVLTFLTMHSPVADMSTGHGLVA